MFPGFPYATLDVQVRCADGVGDDVSANHHGPGNADIGVGADFELARSQGVGSEFLNQDIAAWQAAVGHAVFGRRLKGKVLGNVGIEIDISKVKKRVEELRKKYSLETKGLAESNIRRQLKRLREKMLIEKSENKYYLSEHSSLKEIFENSIEKFILPQIVNRIKEYLNELEK